MEMGEKNKLKIIADAERESKILLESAKQKIESRVGDARGGHVCWFYC